jgi:periplasmic protein TonB
LIATRVMVTASRGPEALRWGACLTVALGLHAAGAAALLGWGEAPDIVADAPVITIELAALPVAPETSPTELPPGPPQPQAESQPEPEPMQPPQNIATLPPAAIAEPLNVVMPPAKPVEQDKRIEKRVEKKPRPKHASLASAPSTVEQRGPRAAAPSPGAASHNPDAVPNWKSQLVARLERFKQYPSQAQARGEQGVAQLSFSVDRGGGVHHGRIVHSSGSSLLDDATLNLLNRAAPMPPPPPEISRAQIAISVPIRYSIR